MSLARKTSRLSYHHPLLYMCNCTDGLAALSAAAQGACVCHRTATVGYCWPDKIQMDSGNQVLGLFVLIVSGSNRIVWGSSSWQ